jgi:hypothetical protein
LRETAWRDAHGSSEIPDTYQATAARVIALRAFFADLLDVSADVGFQAWMVLISCHHDRGWGDYIDHISAAEAFGPRVWSVWSTPSEDLEMAGSSDESAGSSDESGAGDGTDAGFNVYVSDPAMFSDSEAEGRHAE